MQSAYSAYVILFSNCTLHTLFCFLIAICIFCMLFCFLIALYIPGGALSFRTDHTLHLLPLPQVHAGMWRRNGFSLINQIYFYHNVRCRQEMLDRDVMLLQIVATLIDSNEFLVHILNRFNLMNWSREDYEVNYYKVVLLNNIVVTYFLYIFVVLRYWLHISNVGCIYFAFPVYPCKYYVFIFIYSFFLFVLLTRLKKLYIKMNA